MTGDGRRARRRLGADDRGHDANGAAESVGSLRRVLRFGADEEATLRQLADEVLPRLDCIVDKLVARVIEDAQTTTFLGKAEDVARRRARYRAWLERSITGPWDEAYLQERVAIGRMHCQMALPQHYVIGTVDEARMAVCQVADDAFVDDPERAHRACRAIGKVFDLELALLLEGYREELVARMGEVERLERGLLERQLALSEARYDEMVESSGLLVAIFEPDGRVLFLNGLCQEVAGVSGRAGDGRPWAELFAPPELRADVARLCGDALAGRGGGPLDAPAPAIAGAPGRQIRWRFRTLPSATGAVLCAVGLDVTEERELEVRTRRAERLAELGALSAGLAHEIRNPLNSAHLQLMLAERRLTRPSPPDVEGALAATELVAAELRRLAQLVEEFLQFARPQPLHLATVDLREAAEAILTLLAPEATALGVDLRLEASAPAPARVDHERVRQVLLNLVRNALEAARAGGARVVVRAGLRGDAATVEIEDDGPGLQGNEARIFEPFFTTKAGGTGLGLAIVQRIVTDHGGAVSVASRPGRTVFTLTLPAAARPGGEA